MNASNLIPILAAAAVVVSDVWVMWDASRRTADDASVRARIGPVVLTQPTQWFLACIVLWLIVFPLYLVARRR